jgi:hypothetical protein
MLRVTKRGHPGLRHRDQEREGDERRQEGEQCPGQAMPAGGDAEQRQQADRQLDRAEAA